MVTTNFSITYFSVANEIESSGNPGWLLVADAEGMSVLTAWAAGKFDAAVIAKGVKSSGVADKLSHRRIIIPARWRCSPASWRRSCQDGRSRSARGRQWICRGI
jgi:CO dehydrogenase/acetyl-CoA synthase gamma subunit (corrinoid Fe-S protein)